MQKVRKSLTSTKSAPGTGCLVAADEEAAPEAAAPEAAAREGAGEIEGVGRAEGVLGL